MQRLYMTLVLMSAIWAAGGDGPRLQLTWLNANPSVGSNGAIAVEVTGVKNIDTYSLEIAYDTSALSLIDAALDAPLLNVTNPLRNTMQTLLPVIKKEPGRVSIAATLSGAGPSDQTGSISGIFGIAVFKILRDPTGAVTLKKARLLDPNGNDITIVSLVPSP